VLIIWFVYWIEVYFGYNFTKFGILPRELTGLRGVFFSPFIHSDISHLYHNTLPLFVLGCAVSFFYNKLFLRVLLLGILFSGFLTWLIGRPSYHIGASGLIYVFASFLFFKGLIVAYFRLIALSLGVVFYYGSMIWYVFPIKDGVSWEGHLAGGITGLLLAVILKLQLTREKKYPWQEVSFDEKKDPFMSHFDDTGKFIPNRFEPDDPIGFEYGIVYHYKKSEEE
jgi:membrane associated rhomboid family serine protease